MVGEYAKQNLLAKVRGKYQADINNPVDDYGLSIKVLKHPKFTPEGIPYEPRSASKPNNNLTNSFADKLYDTAHEIHSYDTLASMATTAPSIPKYTLGVMSSIDNYLQPANKLLQPTDVANLSKLVSTLEPIQNVSSKIGSALNVVSGVTSGLELGKDIYDAVKNKHVDFDNAMKISDNATGVVSAAASAINPLAGLAITAGEKLVTGVIKGTKAVKDEKKREKVDHLKPDVWLNTVWHATTPAWMNEDIGGAYRNWKNKAPDRKAARKQKKEDYKKLSRKDKVKKFFSPYG
jgi:hypothetical protein